MVQCSRVGLVMCRIKNEVVEDLRREVYEKSSGTHKLQLWYDEERLIETSKFKY